MTDPTPHPDAYFTTSQGKIIHADALDTLTSTPTSAVDLYVTSPPFALITQKSYGNQNADDYLDWFRPFAEQFHRTLKDTGSLVIDIGGSWNAGIPTRSLYHFKLLIMLCEEYGFHLAQEFYWWNPAKLPTPSEWVTVRRVRVKDAVNTVWWLSKTPWPKASNRRVLQPYSNAMKDLIRSGPTRKQKRPSGHDIGVNFAKDNGAAIPPNLLAIPNTDSNSKYLRFCRANSIVPHPARFPESLPEFFVRMLTDLDDLVVDPFAGSCVTGEVCERLGRRWVCVDLCEEYLQGAVARFGGEPARGSMKPAKARVYQVPHPGVMWGSLPEEPLSEDGGSAR